MPKNRKIREKRKERSTSIAAKRRAETHKTGFENTAFEVPDDKKQFAVKSDKPLRLDIIPYEVGEGNPYADKGELHYERTYYVHRGVGVDSTSYVCLNKTCGEPCPICEFRAKLMKDPDADEDLIKDLAPRERQLFNVIDTKEKNKGVQIWDMSYHLFGKKLDAEIKNSDEDDGYENFAELTGGLTLKCGVEEKSFSGQSFYEIVSINFKPRETDYDEDILSETACLDDILIVKDYDELREIFLQTVKNDDSGDDTKSGESKKDRGSKNKKKDLDGGADIVDKASFEKGDRVSAEFDDGTYEGTIKKVKGDEAVVLFDDGDEQTIDCSDLTRLDTGSADGNWSEGDGVIVDFDGTDYAGEITEVYGNTKMVAIKFDDGDTVDDIAFDDLKAGPKKEKSGKKEKDKGSEKNKCPGGGTFGKDTDELPECNDCPIWDECDDA